MSNSESEDDGCAVDFTGFLFGNIDEHGRLENDILDEESKCHLSQLNALTGIGNFVNELADTNKEAAETDEQEKVSTLPDAVDYSNISELTDDEDDLEDDSIERPNTSTENNDPGSFSQTAIFSKGSFKSPYRPADEYIRSEGLRTSESHPGAVGDIILPSIVVHGSSNDKMTSPSRSHMSDSKSKGKKFGKKVKGRSKFDKKKKRREGESDSAHHKKQTAEDMLFEQQISELQSHIKNAAIDELFPEFRPNQVLRFLRLFGKGKQSSMPNRWRNCRKRRKKKRGDVRSMSTEVCSETVFNSGTAGNDNSKAALTQDEECECLTDDEIKMLVPEKHGKINEKNEKSDFTATTVIPEWRYGPAALWYDMLGVPETGEGFDYGFKLKTNPDQTDCHKKITLPSSEHFYMVSQVKWEDDIIWNADDLRNKLGKVNKAAQAGWVPTSTQRTALPHGSQGAKGPLTFPTTDKLHCFGRNNSSPSGEKSNVFNSIFPIENYDLIYGDWENDIIWDDQNMDFIPQPKVFALNPNDENIILSIPEEPKSSSMINAKESKKESLKKSKLLLGKSGGARDYEEDVEDKSISKLDMWNLSNDEFYDPRKSSSNSLAVGLVGALQHSIPAMELQQPFFPTHMGPSKLHHFHRPPLRRYQKGALSKPVFSTVQCLRKHIRQKAKQREQERAASGGGDVFFMRKPEDLSAQDGILILSEYNEEYPPLLSQPGMATKIKTYYKRKPDKDADPPHFRFGEMVYSHTSPFLGSLSPGQSLQAFENNMFRSPIYEHKTPSTDFLIIRNHNGYYIRNVPTTFTIGQLCPLMDVPGPNSKKSTNHVRDFLQVFIYRLFAKSTDNPKRIKMEEIRKAFPSHSESSIRKRLKLCADFNRTGPDSNWWVMKRDFRLPEEDEMRAMVSTEQCCAYNSMLAAEQRLKDAGYGEKTLLYQPEDENGDDHQIKVDEEVLNAPWNTTRAFLSAMKGKCLLQVTGPADPTGCGEGFSYVKVPMKPQQPKDDHTPAPPKRLVTGTDADLRRLSLTNAKNILRKYGVADDEIRKLSRWEVIDVVRTMSTEQARAGGASKFARGTRFSVAEHQERYKEECQRVFDLQNKVLSSHEILSTDEDSSSGDDSDFEEMGKNIESILSNKKSTTQVSHEREEQERKELMKMISEDRNSDFGNAGSRAGGARTPQQAGKKGKDEDVAVNGSTDAGRCLKIFRKFRNETGSEFVRVETVRKPDVIDAYVRIRNSKDEDFIKKFIMMDEQHREEMRREKRRIQEQLRRIKRNQEKDKMNQEKRREKDRKSKDKQDTLKASQMKCGACGQLGHMRTNRFCPMYNRSNSHPDRPVALTEEQEEDMERAMLAESHNLIKVEGTKITLSKDLIKNVEAVRRKSLVLKFQKPESSLSVPKKKRKYQGSVTHCDYLTRPAKKKERKRADPVVTLSSIFEGILNGLRELPSTHPFHCPVNPRIVKDYYKIIEKPMDLQTMRDHLHKCTYLSRADFREHVELIINNSRIYNGHDSPLTKTAMSMLEFCDSQFKEMEDKLMRLEKAINPLLDDDDQVAFSFVLDNIISNKLMTIPESWPFHNPVNKKFVPGYYKVVEHPMDLGTVKKNVQKHMYQNRGQFIEHIELILTNSIKFNGSESKFTETARQIVEVCRATLEEYDEHLTQLENDIAAAKKAAEEEAESITDDDVEMDDVVGSQESSSSYSEMPMDEKMMSNLDMENMDEESKDSQGMSTEFMSNLSSDIPNPSNETSNMSEPEPIQGGHQQSKSFLLEDLLLSDGEMSASDEEEDNPFAGPDSDESDDEMMKSMPVNTETIDSNDQNETKDEIQTEQQAEISESQESKKHTLFLSSEGEDSDIKSESGSFVSVGGEVVSDSELSES